MIRDFDELRPDKVGIFDNSIPLNSRERTWIGDVLHQHVKTLPKKDSKIFPFDAADFKQEMSAAGERLRLVGLHPYQLRHGGAADDLNAKERDHQGVKSRGRWQTDQSVRRYTKVGKIQQIFEPTLTCKSGVLSLVTPQPVQGLQRKGSSEAKLDPLTVDVFSCNHKPHRFALEIFAGTARVSSALCSQGIATFPIDICYSLLMMFWIGCGT